ncbi:Protein of unknown function [Dethiosulfatibacter aminovorans DSM 17477]|uniref:DUF429 domain-containing protein n=1 Tax=Dethiosulfatibacter aminovorans DSM 17477 TaxID=1121476 RepID=A0A1M6MX98_9FIRM|nr:DUF429 domain-containing protein [Dethiosulfatibacter aminovorans]SHJ88069.1 Protein of unknown function [Dethiosulfatibacter aminovorans DSM 17477]
MKPRRIVSIGWDVGGWMGKKQGFSMSLWDYEKEEFSWIGKPSEMSLPKNRLITPDEIMGILSSTFSDRELDEYQIIIAIDAPLGYPEAFVKFISSEDVISAKPDKEINNPLAYRDTERHIHKVFDKKPLSSVFDKIGNNATVAISHIRTWSSEHEYIVQPSNRCSKREIIEVYPALVKGNDFLQELFDEIIPDTVKRESDAYDSAICSIMGLKYYLGEEFLGVPVAVGPVEDIEQKEGWIYYLIGPTN